MGNIKMPEDYLTKLWREKDFCVIGQRLFEAQRKITELTLEDRTQERIQAQDDLNRKIDFRCLAVEYVAKNSKAPGADGVVWKTDAEKMQAAFDLDIDSFKASPIRIWRTEQKSSGKMRRYGIPTFQDRAMCVLMGYSLLPVIEVYHDKKSFCNRKGRSIYDAFAYTMEAIKGKDAPGYVVCTDVEAYYSSISHDWLMKYVPMNKHVLHELLRANIIEAGNVYSRNGFGIPEGCNLSPYLGNYVLDGLQKHIYTALHGEYSPNSDIDYANGNMIRYADDILVTVRTQAEGVFVLKQIEEFARQRGLHLKEEKTSIVPIEQGFDFLKFFFVKEGNVVVTEPSRKAVDKLKADLVDIVNANVKNQRRLIQEVNRKLNTFGNKYKFCDSRDVFREVDGYVHNLLMDTMRIIHPKLSDVRRFNLYWYRDYKGELYFSLPKERGVRVMKLDEVVLLKYTPVPVTVNYFRDREFLEDRHGVTSENNVTKQYRPIWERQGGCCYYCGNKMLPDQPIELITRNLSVKPGKSNLAYIHKICRQSDLMYCYTQDDVEGMSPLEVENMLLYAGAEKKIKQKLKGEWKYRRLQDYFEKKRGKEFSLTFAKLEKISKHPISEAMRKDRNRWYRRKGVNTMPDAWEEEGFYIEKLDLEKEIVVFKRRVTGKAKLEVPKVLLEEEINVHVKEEIEHYLRWIVQAKGIGKGSRGA